MRKNVFGRHFKRDTNERKALFKGLISSLVLHGRIKTTEEKAKSIRREVDKIITKAKKGEEKARYLLQSQLPKKAIEKVIFEITPRFDNRQGGYTRIVKIGRRFSDNAPMALMEWTEQNQIKNDPFDKTQGHPERSRTDEKLKIKNGRDEEIADAKAQKLAKAKIRKGLKTQKKNNE